MDVHVKRLFLLGLMLIAVSIWAGAAPKLKQQEASEMLERRGIIQAGMAGLRAASRDELSVMLERLDQANEKALRNFASRQEMLELRKQVESMRAEGATLNEKTGTIEAEVEDLDQR